jgi:cob(I)alamin adenosyltransferase
MASAEIAENDHLDACLERIQDNLFDTGGRLSLCQGNQGTPRVYVGRAARYGPP